MEKSWKSLRVKENLTGSLFLERALSHLEGRGKKEDAAIDLRHLFLQCQGGGEKRKASPLLSGGKGIVVDSIFVRHSYEEREG